MERTRVLRGALVVTATLLAAPGALAFEVQTPAITEVTAVGERVAHWHGPEAENLILLSFDVSSALRGTFTRAHTTGDVLGYASVRRLRAAAERVIFGRTRRIDGSTVAGS